MPEARLKSAGVSGYNKTKRKRIKAGSGERMREVGSKGAPTKKNFVRSAKTAKKVK